MSKADHNNKNEEPAFVYADRIKRNLNSAGQNLQKQKRLRVAVIVAGVALAALLAIMIICIVNVSPSAQEKRVVRHVEVIHQLNTDATNRADTLHLPETSDTE